MGDINYIKRYPLIFFRRSLNLFRIHRLDGEYIYIYVDYHRSISLEFLDLHGYMDMGMMIHDIMGFGYVCMGTF